MEGINKEEIERMDDFVFHLSDNQLSEWKDDLKIKQPLIYEVFTKNIRTNKASGEQDNMFRIVFVTLKCFDAYNVRIPMFTAKEISKYDSKWRAVYTGFNKEFSATESLLKTAETFNQIELISYIFDKFKALDFPMPDFDIIKTAIKNNTLNVIVMMYSNKVDEILSRPLKVVK